MIYTAHIKNISVDINFKNTDLDRMHHALGRPLFPLKEHYRNHFAARQGSSAANDLTGNPNWKRKRSTLNAGMLFFEVTERGKSALAAAMAEKKITEKLFQTTHPKARKLTVQAPSLDIAKNRLRVALLAEGHESKGSIDAAIATMAFNEVK